jgi:hypothetical protein
MAWSSEDNGWVLADPDDLLATAVSLEWASTLLFMLDILVNERRVLLLHTNYAMRVLYIIIYTQKERWGLMEEKGKVGGEKEWLVGVVGVKYRCWCLLSFINGLVLGTWKLYYPNLCQTYYKF